MRWWGINYLKIIKFNSLGYFITSFSLLFSSFICLLIALVSFCGYEISVEWELCVLRGVKLSILLLFDFISLLFFSTVALIAGRVFLYSSSYIRSEIFSNRFILLVLRFVIRMIILIFRPNLISLLLGWDGLGVTSYLLVCFYRSEKRFNARMLTALTNRLGDVAILIIIGLNISNGLFNYGLVNFSNLTINYESYFIIGAAITKSAQIPFSAWLPAAMAAPTPVSALVHSSTLVTAGVYLLIRFNFIFSNLDYTWFMLVVGCFTMIIAGISAIIELDMKKVIALSTLSQLGVIFFRLGMDHQYLAFFHLISHAYFKAIIFIGAGAIIHSVKDYQDIRKIGTWSRINPVIRAVFLTASLRLCGIPFIRGFYSKDLILEIILGIEFNFWVLFLSIVATVFTVIYSSRVAIILFVKFSRRESFRSERDSLDVMTIRMMFLILPSIAGGYLLSGFLPTTPVIFLPLWLKLMIIVSILIAFFLFLEKKIVVIPVSKLLRALQFIWFIPTTLRPLFTSNTLMLAKTQHKAIDQSWLPWVVAGFLNYSSGKAYWVSSTKSRLVIGLLFFLILVIIV